MEITFGDATLVVDFTDNYDDSEEAGFGGSFEVNRKQYAELYEACEFELYGIDEDATTFDPEEHDDDDELYVPNGDDFITFANAASIEGGRWEITYNGPRYWFFHDLSHAEYDCSGGHVMIDGHGTDENRALLDGAERAHKHGVSLSEIFRELANVLQRFEERFARPTDVIERFAEYLENVLTSQPAEV